MSLFFTCTPCHRTCHHCVPEIFQLFPLLSSYLLNQQLSSYSQQFLHFSLTSDPAISSHNFYSSTISHGFHFFQGFHLCQCNITPEARDRLLWTLTHGVGSLSPNYQQVSYLTQSHSQERESQASGMSGKQISSGLAIVYSQLSILFL